jgi:hypothetical protein
VPIEEEEEMIIVGSLNRVSRQIILCGRVVSQAVYNSAHNMVRPPVEEFFKFKNFFRHGL